MLDFGAEGIAPFQRKEQKKEVVACVVGYRLGEGSNGVGWNTRF
jgi:hypothetical protein